METRKHGNKENTTSMVCAKRSRFCIGQYEKYEISGLLCNAQNIADVG